ncbi:hypothetical protein KCU71_g8258, partial [Aureobasidium melanogenum]
MDWDDEKDGDWLSFRVQDSNCDEVSGCGSCKGLMKKDSEYKGKLFAPMIEHKDVWALQKIDNPEYIVEKTPSKFKPMGAMSLNPATVLQT